MFKLISICLMFVCIVFPTVHAQDVGGPCVGTPTTLCLNNNRFQVDVDWSAGMDNPQNVSQIDFGGQARNRPVSDNWGGFWFFDPANLGLLVHIFPGCGFNDRYWVFAAGLTHVEVTMTVTDTETGESRVFNNPEGMPFAPIDDTNAFSTCPKSAAMSPIGEVDSLTSLDRIEAHDGSGDCAESSTVACLHDGRFELSVETGGTSSPVQQLADGTAGFLYSNPTFFDLAVSIIDGRSNNGQFWVTYSMFEAIPFVLTITDHVSGETRIYDHGRDDPLLVQDQEAFVGGEVLAVDGTLSGSWYSPARDGEGFIVDIFEAGGVPTLVLYYFTFENNDSGRQAWLIGSAPLIGNKASVPVIIAEGANFGSTFDPGDVVRIDWGDIKITFNDCGNALVKSNSPLFPSVNHALIRLTPSPTGVQGVCQTSVPVTATVEESSRPEAVSLVDGGYSGSWYTVERDGEGLIFNIAEIGGVNTLVVFYFTYENGTTGRQAWMVGSAPIIGDSADVPMIIAEGAQFGDLFDPAAVVRTPWGNVKVTWETCNLAHIVVTSESFGDINFDVNPLTPSPIGSTGDCGL